MKRLGNLLRPDVVAAFDRGFFKREGFWVWEGVLTEEARARWTASLQKLQQMNDEIVVDTDWAAIDAARQKRRHNPCVGRFSLATGRPIPILKEHDVAENEPSSHPAPDDMHWGISYLREDLQDLRHEMRALHGRIDQISESLTRRIDSRFALLLTAMIALDGLVVGAIIAFLKLYLPS